MTNSKSNQRRQARNKLRNKVGTQKEPKE